MPFPHRSLGMTFRLGLSALVLLALLFPHVQSGRARYLDNHPDSHSSHAPHHPHSHSSHHHRSLDSHGSHLTRHGAAPMADSNLEGGSIIQMVTRTPEQVHHSKHPDSHSSHHHRSLDSHGSHLTRHGAAPMADSNLEGSSNIQMVTRRTPEQVHHSKQDLASILDTPVSGPNPGGNSQILASILDTSVSETNPGGNSASLATVLDSPVSGPNPEGNEQIFAASSGPNPGGNSEILEISVHLKTQKQNLAASSGPNPAGNSQNLVASSGPNPGGNSASLATVLDTPVSGPNPGGNEQILAASSGPNPGGNLETLMVKKATEVEQIFAASSGPNPGGNSEILMVNKATEVEQIFAASSGPNPGGNSEILTVMKATEVSVDHNGDKPNLAANSAPNPGVNFQNFAASSGPNPGGNSDILMVEKAAELERHKHIWEAKADELQLAEVLDTPVSGPNPSGNSEILFTNSGSNPGYNAENLASVLDTPVSGPNPGGNSESLASVLDTPVSGPNPGGNSQQLVASPRPNRGSAAHGSGDHGTTEKVVLDAYVSVPNPGGNSEILFSSSGSNLRGNSHTPDSESVVSGIDYHGNSRTMAATSITNALAAVSGPNPGGNSEILASSAPSEKLSRTVVDKEILAASPGANAHISADRKSFRTGEQKAAAALHTLGSQARMHHAEQATIFSELPRAPVPPSTPSPGHNSVITSANFVSTSVTKRKAQEEQTTIGCDHGENILSNMFQTSKVLTREDAFPHNTIVRMGIATRSVETIAGQ